MLVYATIDDLTAWDDALDQPADVARYLRNASLLVAAAVYEDPYNEATTTNAAKTDATCAQVEAWVRSSTDPSALGITDETAVQSKTLQSGGVTYSTSTAMLVAQERAKLAGQLCPEALAILRAAQLLHVDLPQWEAVPNPGVFVSEVGQVNGYNPHVGPYSGWPYGV